MNKPISQTLRAIERKILDGMATIDGYGSRITAAELEVERAEQKLRPEGEGKATRGTWIASGANSQTPPPSPPFSPTHRTLPTRKWVQARVGLGSGRVP